MMNSNMGMAMVCMIEDNKESTISIDFNKNNLSQTNLRIKKNILSTTESTLINVLSSKPSNQVLRNSTIKHLTITTLKTTTNKTKKTKNKLNYLYNNIKQQNKQDENNITKYNIIYQLKKHAISPLASKVKWSAEDQGWIFGAFNAGLLCMLVTGFLADKFNAKYMIIVSVLIASGANIMIPLMAEYK